MVVHGGDHTVTVNGGANQTISAGSLQTVTYSNSGNATFIMTFHRGGGADTGVRAIQINGVILTDPLKRFGDAAATNFNPFITDINAVRGQETGYCTMNPLDQKFTDNGTISNGNLDYSQSSTGARAARCTIGVSSGKWYWEFTHLGGNNSHGIQGTSSDLGSYPGGSDDDGISWFVGGNIYRNGSTSTYSGKTYAVGDCIGTALDLDNGTLVYYKNGVSQGVAASGLTGTWFPSFGSSNVSVVSFTSNFGQKPFKFPPPDGFQPLNLANTRQETFIARPDQYVDVATYTAAGGSSAVTVNSYNFAPDPIWIKDRDDSGNWNQFDTVRGYGKRLDTTGAGREQDWSSYFGSFEPNGFTVTDQNSDLNRNTNRMCSWGWKRSGGNPGITTTAFWVDDIEYASAAAAGLNGGTITPVSASVGTRQGFSMLTYRSNLTTGATLSHGLTQKPDFAIFKNCDSTLGADEVDWGVYHTSIGATKRLELNQQLGSSAFPGPFNDTEPTSSLFTFGGGSQGHSYMTNNPANEKFVAWIWHNVPGLQKFGKFTTGNAFVELGFRPAVLIIKSESNSRNWILIDGGRSTFNPSRKVLLVNDSSNESDNSVYDIDFVSNGFKVRGSNGQVTGDSSYVYAAWAAAPSFNLYGAQSNAR